MATVEPYLVESDQKPSLASHQTGLLTSPPCQEDQEVLLKSIWHHPLLVGDQLMEFLALLGQLQEEVGLEVEPELVD